MANGQVEVYLGYGDPAPICDLATQNPHTFYIGIDLGVKPLIQLPIVQFRRTDFVRGLNTVEAGTVDRVVSELAFGHYGPVKGPCKWDEAYNLEAGWLIRSRLKPEKELYLVMMEEYVTRMIILLRSLSFRLSHKAVPKEARRTSWMKELIVNQDEELEEIAGIKLI